MDLTLGMEAADQNANAKSLKGPEMIFSVSPPVQWL